MNPGRLGWTITDHMAKFSTAEAKAIVHATLSFFWLEPSIWTKEVHNSVDSANGSGIRLPVDVPQNPVCRSSIKQEFDGQSFFGFHTLTLLAVWWLIQCTVYFLGLSRSISASA